MRNNVQVLDISTTSAAMCVLYLVISLLDSDQLLAHPLLALPLGLNQVLQLQQLIIINTLQRVLIQRLLLNGCVALQGQEWVTQAETTIFSLIQKCLGSVRLNI